jgi:hypothetical protein
MKFNNLSELNITYMENKKLRIELNSEHLF